ncbi:proline-rich protein 2-like [Pezoporus occidentalis]|uniref:proline-rich protein 2-like n=1 Tax=Pezoporus occidentalis TaxID=407982 RepID=UPI002F913A80
MCQAVREIKSEKTSGNAERCPAGFKSEAQPRTIRDRALLSPQPLRTEVDVTAAPAERGGVSVPGLPPRARVETPLTVPPPPPQPEGSPRPAVPTRRRLARAQGAPPEGGGGRSGGGGHLETGAPRGGHRPSSHTHTQPWGRAPIAHHLPHPLSRQPAPFPPHRQRGPTGTAQPHRTSQSPPPWLWGNVVHPRQLWDPRSWHHPTALRLLPAARTPGWWRRARHNLTLTAEPLSPSPLPRWAGPGRAGRNRAPPTGAELRGSWSPTAARQARPRHQHPNARTHTHTRRESSRSIG